MIENHAASQEFDVDEKCDRTWQTKEKFIFNSKSKCTNHCETAQRFELR